MFVRGRVPLTRLEIRAAAPGPAAHPPGGGRLGRGAGTGGMAVTLARAGARVYAVERNPAALQLLEHNGRRWAPSPCALSPARPRRRGRPAPPDAAFVGGSGGRMEEIIAHIARANPRARWR